MISVKKPGFEPNRFRHGSSDPLAADFYKKRYSGYFHRYCYILITNISSRFKKFIDDAPGGFGFSQLPRRCGDPRDAIQLIIPIKAENPFVKK
jgi:hypothetical protein